MSIKDLRAVAQYHARLAAEHTQAAGASAHEPDVQLDHRNRAHFHATTAEQLTELAEAFTVFTGFTT
jgi:hypothetical protein